MNGDNDGFVDDCIRLLVGIGLWSEDGKVDDVALGVIARCCGFTPGRTAEIVDALFSAELLVRNPGVDRPDGDPYGWADWRDLLPES